MVPVKFFLVRPSFGNTGKHPLSYPPSIPVELLSRTDNLVDDTFASYILAAFHAGPVGELCRSDWAIQTVGQHQWAKTIKDDKTGTMTAMRRLPHMVLECRKLILCSSDTNTSEDFDCEDMFRRKNFDIVTKALHNYSKGETKCKASLQVGVSYLLRSSAETLRAVYLIREQDDRADELGKFLIILTNQWKNITNKANGEILMRSQEILRRPAQLPLEEDIMSLKEYSMTCCNKLLENETWTTFDFNQLRTLLVCRLTLFNARRSGEPAKLLLKDWSDAENGAWIDPRFQRNLSPADQLLMGQYKLTYIPGKGKSLVPLLFPEDLVPGMQKLVSLRKHVGINPNNRFVFAATRGSTRPVMGNQCIAAVCLAAGVTESGRVTGANETSRVTATKVRHRASTMYAGLDVPEKDRATFYRHMGHSAQINADNYQCPQAIQEVLIVGKHLANMDNPALGNGKKDKLVSYTGTEISKN